MVILHHLLMHWLTYPYYFDENKGETMQCEDQPRYFSRHTIRIPKTFDAAVRHSSVTIHHWSLAADAIQRSLTLFPSWPLIGMGWPSLLCQRYPLHWLDGQEYIKTYPNYWFVLDSWLYLKPWSWGVSKPRFKLLVSTCISRFVIALAAWFHSSYCSEAGRGHPMSIHVQ